LLKGSSRVFAQRDLVVVEEDIAKLMLCVELGERLAPEEVGLRKAIGRGARSRREYSLRSN